MERAGIREARQNLSKLIDEVRQRGEVVITERGKPVARLVRYAPAAARPFPDRSALRREMPVLEPALSATVIEDREDRF
ncbi:MAG: type II toxin-antitoxin system prevent-host-death family antitoxin [Acidobacteriota bacterium]|nr:type II toxin-antitoxin system prevent-host-death family antitoxin [Acidobacteriota bacterium]MDH3523329.1 type II toxin-antitoxin system prevent-host-death family antitoxin [Acidobacteriota bacterium]